MLSDITKDTESAVRELIETAKLGEGQILVVGCSSSEIGGHSIGSYASLDLAQAVVNGILPVLLEKKIALAAQCCEHLNRAIIIEEEVARSNHLPVVNAVPQPTAGGSFAASVYQRMKKPVAVESIQADAGIDIGDTLIGMHLKSVAVPVRISIKTIGNAHVVCARTRCKYIGGERAQYDPRLG